MKNKGQGAMEYLMTYGWAILVVIIVGIVLWQSGVFGTSAGGVSGFNKVRIEDYAYSSGALNISFENAAGQTMKTVTVSYSGDVDTDGVVDSTWTGTSSWAPGKEYANSLESANATACSTSGAGYTVEVTIAYTSEAGLNHTETGTIRGTCE